MPTRPQVRAPSFLAAGLAGSPSTWLPRIASTVPAATSFASALLDGVLAGEFLRDLEYNSAYYGVDDVWAVADIVGNSDTDFYLDPLPSDTAQPGVVGYLCQATDDYGTAWWNSNCPTNDWGSGHEFPTRFRAVGRGH